MAICTTDRGRRAPPPAATTSFNALLQLHGDAGRHFLLGDQQLHADGAAPPVAAASQYAGNQPLYSSYGDDVPAAALMTKPPFPQQEFFASSSSTRNFGDMTAAPPMTTKPLLLQALEQKAFKV